MLHSHPTRFHTPLPFLATCLSWIPFPQTCLRHVSYEPYNGARACECVCASVYCALNSPFPPPAFAMRKGTGHEHVQLANHILPLDTAGTESPSISAGPCPCCPCRLSLIHCPRGSTVLPACPGTDHSRGKAKKHVASQNGIKSCLCTLGQAHGLCEKKRRHPSSSEKKNKSRPRWNKIVRSGNMIITESFATSSTVTGNNNEDDDDGDDGTYKTGPNTVWTR